MIKLIYRIFKKKLNKLVFDSEVLHGDWRDKCEVYYVDNEGMKYYRYRNQYDMPVMRYEYLQGLVVLFEIGFNSKDYKLFLDAFDKEIENVANEYTAKKGMHITQLAKISTIINELKARSEIRLEPTLLLEMMACVLVREDEKPEIVDHKIQDIKVQTFKTANKDRQSAFFLKAGLNAYLPYLELLEKDWMKYMAESTTELKMRTEILNTLMPQYKPESEPQQSKE